ncbi:MAG: type II toxin-antitoxin system Phd/YefM family antitoxin [Novosphingobium sp.]
MLVETFSNARNNLKAVMDRVVANRAPLKITRQRGEGVVMISESDWESMEETLYLLSSPKNAAMLAESIAELDAGRGQVRELIDP